MLPVAQMLRRYHLDGPGAVDHDHPTVLAPLLGGFSFLTLNQYRALRAAVIGDYDALELLLSRLSKWSLIFAPAVNSRTLE